LLLAFPGSIHEILTPNDHGSPSFATTRTSLSENLKMSKTVEIQSTEQFNELLSKSRIVVADCEFIFFAYPAISTKKSATR
jgi:hypothetical protein